MKSRRMDARRLVDGFAERASATDLRSGLAPDHYARYLFAAQFVSGSAVADLCCGIGYGSNLLLAAGATGVVGIDRDPEAIATARQQYPGPDFRLSRADQSLDLSAFPMRVCLEGIEHVQEPEVLLQNMEGAEIVIVSSPNAELFAGGFSGNPHHVQEWSRAEFEAMLLRHFTTVQLHFQWFYPDPLDQEWGWRAAARAAIPVSLKSRLRSSVPVNGEETNKGLPADHRVYPASYLSVLPPGLRYGKPHTWLAVCKP
jgi:SAM-dependent methyltransferase